MESRCRLACRARLSNPAGWETPAIPIATLIRCALTVIFSIGVAMLDRSHLKAAHLQPAGFQRHQSVPLMFHPDRGADSEIVEESYIVREQPAFVAANGTWTTRQVPTCRLELPICGRAGILAKPAHFAGYRMRLRPLH
ncbi:hypothetical protein CHELA20_11506 [Hyphomicrobiales bacterium]|nr:hypothetical protein CHELA20_11506 [Hyphomicrobiales bacterium]